MKEAAMKLSSAPIVENKWTEIPVIEKKGGDQKRYVPQ